MVGRWALFFVALVAGIAGATAAAFWLPENPDHVRVPIPGPTVTVTATPDPADAGGPEVFVYRLGRECEVDRRQFFRATPIAPPDEGVLKAALVGLFDEWGDPRLVRSVAIDGGIATVDFERLSGSAVSWGSTSCGSVAFVAALNKTVFQFENISGVRFREEGSCEAFYGFLQRSCESGGVLTRREWYSSPLSYVRVRYET